MLSTQHTSARGKLVSVHGNPGCIRPEVTCQLISCYFYVIQPNPVTHTQDIVSLSYYNNGWKETTEAVTYIKRHHNEHIDSSTY